VQVNNNLSQSSMTTKLLASSENVGEHTNAVAQAFGPAIPVQLEEQLLTWFLQQKPELGKSLALLLNLQRQLTDETQQPMTGNTKNTAMVTEILESLKNLLITPKEIQAGRATLLTRTQDSLLLLLKELQSPQAATDKGVQAKIADLIATLHDELSGVEEEGTIAEKKQEVMHAFRPVKNPTFFKPQDGTSVSANNLDSGSEPAFITTNSSSASAEDQPDSLLTSAKQQNLSADPKPGQKNQVLEKQTPGSNVELLEQLNVMKNTVAPENNLLNPKAVFPQQASEIPELVALKESIRIILPQNEKVQILLSEIATELPEKNIPPHIKQIFTTLINTLRSLSVNPETQWDRLLQYPLIYKQTLHKTTKLLQDLLQEKAATGTSVHDKTIELLGEITANLRVQIATNQTRQDNPAHQQMYYQIPIEIGKEIKNGEMLVIHEREKNGNKWQRVASMYRFYLETEYLGPVDIMLQAVDKQLNIAFTATEAAYADVIEAQSTGLRRILSEHGYDLKEIQCRVGNVSPLLLLGTDGAQHHRVNIMI
jgi:hypothetical protein